MRRREIAIRRLNSVWIVAALTLALTGCVERQGHNLHAYATDGSIFGLPTATAFPPAF